VNVIRPQINTFLEGFNELIPRELVSIFNDKELELLISGLPEIDFGDLTANTPSTPATRQDPMLFIGSFRRFQGTASFNQLDLPEYQSKEQLEERLYLPLTKPVKVSGLLEQSLSLRHRPIR
ncbi:unnamed protein product, partial [Brassica oleracea]